MGILKEYHLAELFHHLSIIFQPTNFLPTRDVSHQEDKTDLKT